MACQPAESCSEVNISYYSSWRSWYSTTQENNLFPKPSGKCSLLYTFTLPWYQPIGAWGKRPELLTSGPGFNPWCRHVRRKFHHSCKCHSPITVVPACLSGLTQAKVMLNPLIHLIHPLPGFWNSSLQSLVRTEPVHKPLHQRVTHWCENQSLLMPTTTTLFPPSIGLARGPSTLASI